MKRLLATVVLSLMLMGGATAGSLDDALNDAAGAALGGDYATALRMLRPLAEQGDPSAQTMLGTLYDEGQGVPQDYEEAVKWYRLAAEQGWPPGQDHLGQMYEEGRGVPKSYVEAYKWVNLAASGASRSTEPFGGLWVNDRDLLAAKMTPEQIAEGQRLARQWRPK